MALNKEVWVAQIKEGFYPKGNFLEKSIDFSQFVDNNKIHIPSAGINPDVLINNNTYPIAIVERDDDDNAIPLDKFETVNTLIRRPEAIEYSYDKLESVIKQHRSTLLKSVSTKAAHAYAPLQDTANTPVIMTTGDTSDNGRKMITFYDILTMKERFDAAGIPLEDRYMILHPKHVTDLLRSDIKIFKELTDLKDGEPFKFAGFGMYQFAFMPHYELKSGALKKVAFSAVPTQNRFASVAFQRDEVMRADGEIHMYSRVDDPEERATIVGFDKRFIALPIRGLGVGSIVTDIVA